MKLLRTRIFAAVFAAFAAAAPVAAFAQEATPGSSEHDVVPTLVWMALGVAVFAIVLAMLYFVKKAVGGFPKNPSWVAPISIRPSSDFPGDDASGHDAHGGAHASAH